MNNFVSGVGNDSFREMVLSFKKGKFIVIYEFNVN